MIYSQETVQRIRLVAKEKNITIKQLLEVCGLGKNTIAKMTSGNDIQTHNFAKIADCLECSVDYLLGRAEEKELSNGLSEYEIRLLNIYRSLSPQGQEYIQQTADMAALKYKKAILSSDIKKTVN